MISTMRYQLNQNITVTRIDHEVVVLNLSNGAYYGLDRIGAQLVQALESHTPLDQLVRRIAEQQQMQYVAVSSDIDELIQQLLDQNLLIKTS